MKIFLTLSLNCIKFFSKVIFFAAKDNSIQFQLRLFILIVIELHFKRFTPSRTSLTFALSLSRTHRRTHAHSTSHAHNLKAFLFHTLINTQSHTNIHTSINWPPFSHLFFHLLSNTRTQTPSHALLHALTFSLAHPFSMNSMSELFFLSRDDFFPSNSSSSSCSISHRGRGMALSRRGGGWESWEHRNGGLQPPGTRSPTRRTSEPSVSSK